MSKKAILWSLLYEFYGLALYIRLYLWWGKECAWLFWNSTGADCRIINKLLVIRFETFTVLSYLVEIQLKE